MSDWTLGAVKARNMEIVALCDQEGCRHLFVFNLDQLIEGVGPDYLLADIPPMACRNAGSARSSSASPSPTPRRKRGRARLINRAASSLSLPGLTRQSSNHLCHCRA
jgi:hypothetical protein